MEKSGKCMEDAEPVPYVFQTGDSLEGIAERFGVSVSWLKQLNHVHLSGDPIPGDVILVKPEFVEDPVDPIEVTLFDIDSPEIVEVAGTLLLDGDQLRFEAPGRTPMIIDLRDVNETAVVPHPFAVPPADINDPNARFLLSVSGFSDVGDKTFVVARYFIGPNSILREFQKKLADRVAAVGDDMEKSKKRLLASVQVTPPRPRPPSKTEPKRSNTAPSVSPVLVRSKSKMQLPETRMIGESYILSTSEILELRRSIPLRFRNGSWRLLFCLSKYGCSYQTFFSQTEKKSPVILAILTDSGERLGCYTSSAFTCSRRYYGSGETFVFKLQPQLQVFRWSQANEFFTYSTSQEIAIGGGGSSAIWIDGNLLNAYSESCSTFNSPGLTQERSFKIKNIEAWQIES